MIDNDDDFGGDTDVIDIPLRPPADVIIISSPPVSDEPQVRSRTITQRLVSRGRAVAVLR